MCPLNPYKFYANQSMTGSSLKAKLDCLNPFLFYFILFLVHSEFSHTQPFREFIDKAIPLNSGHASERQTANSRVKVDWNENKSTILG
jgi:hypothetical protein